MSEGYSLTRCKCDPKQLDDDFPTIEFSMGEAQIKLLPSDYMLYDGTRGIQECALGFTQSHENEWVFSNTFTRNFFTVYDLEASKIGFGKHLE